MLWVGVSGGGVDIAADGRLERAVNGKVDFTAEGRLEGATDGGGLEGAANSGRFG